MRYFFDCEFLERPHDPNPSMKERSGGVLDLISIGVVAEDGREFYAEMRDIPWQHAHPWVIENVRPKLHHGFARMRRADVMSGIMNLVGDDTEPEWWAYYGDYDWVALCWLFGRMIDLPPAFPMFCRDFKQYVVERGNPTLPKLDASEEHDALADARWLRNTFLWLQAEHANPEEDLDRWLTWSGGDYPDDSPGDVIASWPDGAIMLDDGVTTWNPLRALEYEARERERMKPVMKAVRRYINAEKEGHRGLIEDSHTQLLRVLTDYDNGVTSW